MGIESTGVERPRPSSVMVRFVGLLRDSAHASAMRNALAERAGVPFAEPTPEDEIDAAIAAAVATWRRSSVAEPAPGSNDAWKRAARLENLRAE